jgi:hypothetical protein
MMPGENLPGQADWLFSVIFARSAASARRIGLQLQGEMCRF